MGFREKKIRIFVFLFFLNNADVENCDASRGFSFIYKIMLMWKIVVLSEASILYIYIYIDKGEDPQRRRM